MQLDLVEIKNLSITRGKIKKEKLPLKKKLKKTRETNSTESLAGRLDSLMSVCVSSSLSGMSHVSHLHSTLSMMQPFQNHHQMAPSSTAVLPNGLEISHAQPSSQQLQMQNSSSSSSSDGNEPNPEMLLALIARNKTLEGEFF